MDPFALGPLAAWHHKTVTPPRARVLLIHGISEHSGRHLNTVSALLSLGIEVVRFDLRGSGQSGGKRQWIEKFDDYVEDATSVFNWICSQLPEAPLFLYGHSLGGAIATHFAARYGSSLAGLVLSAPAFRTGSSITPLKIALGRILVRFAPTLRLPNDGDYGALSRDPEVTEAYKNDPLSSHFNTLQQGDQVLRALEKMPERCAQILIPTIIFHGSADRVVLCEGSFTLLKSLASQDKELVILPSGYHEPHNDIDKQSVFSTLGLWLERKLRAVSAESKTAALRSRPAASV